MEVDYRYEGFDELEEAGFKVSYCSLDKKEGVIRYVILTVMVMMLTVTMLQGRVLQKV